MRLVWTGTFIAIISSGFITSIGESHILIENLQKSHDILKSDFLSINPREVEPEVLVNAEVNVALRLDRLQEYVENNYLIDLNRYLNEFRRQILSLWRKKAKQKRFYYIDENVRKVFGLKKEFCQNKKDCFPLQAAYIPYLDLIVVEPQADPNKLSALLYHEMVHAYQYTFRLPLDLSLLGEIATNAIKEVTIPIEDMIDFLKFYYESQAFYYTLKIFPDQRWIKTGATTGEIRSDRLLTIPIASTFAFLDILTLESGQRKVKESITKWFPSVDQEVIVKKGSHQKKQGDQIKLFSEIVTFRNLSKVDNFFFVGDLPWFLKASSRVEYAYFGVIPFLRNPGGGDQLINKLLHDQFYKKILGVPLHYQHQRYSRNRVKEPRPNLRFYEDEVEYEMGQCTTLLNKISQGVPFLEWFTVDSKDLSCDIFREFIVSDRWKYLELINNAHKRFFGENSPYESGVEGGGGPSLYIHPQLDLGPE